MSPRRPRTKDLEERTLAARARWKETLEDSDYRAYQRLADELLRSRPSSARRKPK